MSTRGKLLEAVVGAAARSSFGIDLPTLKLALAKVQRRQQGSAEEFAQVELDALSAWMGLQLASQGKIPRAEASERNKAAWSAGDRSKWGGEVRKRDRRRGWRNYEDDGTTKAKAALPRSHC